MKALFAPILVAVSLIWPTLSHSAPYWDAPTTTWRYRMTVTVETPEGVKTGSAVREVTHRQGLHLTPEMNSNVSVKGEAVVVDLGKYGVLFALLSGAIHDQNYGEDIIFNVLPAARGKTGLDRIPPKGKVVVLTPEQYPLFVRFRNLRNASTLESVTQVYIPEPHHLAYLLEGQKFGEGVRLKDVTLEITDAPVTGGQVVKLLPWLRRNARTWVQKTNDDGTIPNTDTATLTSRDFFAGNIDGQ